MTAFVVVVCLLSYGFAHFYIPPSSEYRIWPDVSPTTATLIGLLSANLFVWLAWRWTPLWPFLTQHFMHTPAYPRAHQSVTNVFTHMTHEHLIANMVALVLAGSMCHELVGRGIFMGTYMSAGAVGTLVSLYWANLGRGAILAHSVGASAAVYGIVALYLALTDRERVQIPFVKDMSVGFYPKSLLAAVVAVELFNARRGLQVADHASHFGGIIAGLSVAGFMHYRGFHSGHRQKMGLGMEGNTLGEVEQKAGVDEKTVDLGKVVKQEVTEVKAEVKKVTK